MSQCDSPGRLQCRQGFQEEEEEDYRAGGDHLGIVSSFTEDFPCSSASHPLPPTGVCLEIDSNFMTILVHVELINLQLPTSYESN